MQVKKKWNNEKSKKFAIKWNWCSLEYALNNWMISVNIVLKYQMLVVAILGACDQMHELGTSYLNTLFKAVGQQIWAYTIAKQSIKKESIV